MRTRLVLCAVVALLLVTILATGLLGSGAYFSDTETSKGNTFSAGTLDLAIDGKNNENSVRITVSNIKPGFQRVGTWKLENLGSLPGYLDLEDIKVTGAENSIEGPEAALSDTDADGELQNLVGLELHVDEPPVSGWFGTEDTKIYDGKASGVASNYDQNLLIPSKGTKHIAYQFQWWSTTNDNIAMSDSFTFDVTFQLAQTAAQ